MSLASETVRFLVAAAIVLAATASGFFAYQQTEIFGYNLERLFSNRIVVGSLGIQIIFFFGVFILHLKAGNRLAKTARVLSYGLALFCLAGVIVMLKFSFFEYRFVMPRDDGRGLDTEGSEQGAADQRPDRRDSI